MPPTTPGGRKDKEPKADDALLINAAAPRMQNTKVSGQVLDQEEQPKEAASKESCDADPNTQLERAATNESAEESPSRKRALTPPYIPEKGLHQTWPAFGFKSVSKEGARALRYRTVKFDSVEEYPSKTTPPRTSRGSKGSTPNANIQQDSAGKSPGTVHGERREDDHIDNHDWKRVRKGRLL